MLDLWRCHGADPGIPAWYRAPGAPAISHVVGRTTTGRAPVGQLTVHMANTTMLDGPAASGVILGGLWSLGRAWVGPQAALCRIEISQFFINKKLWRHAMIWARPLRFSQWGYGPLCELSGPHTCAPLEPVQHRYPLAEGV